jgi:hypothetical protein
MPSVTLDEAFEAIGNESPFMALPHGRHHPAHDGERGDDRS